ncbi:MAG: sugar ABC transporter substrate-binding protein [Butyricicoccus pullicaecorum]|nr:sugar ABC transporter substrate-binding protein [Butyricicoccus pullicaecorum]
MKKRLLAMLMAGAMTLTMTACGGPKTDEGEGGSAQAGGKTYKIALLMSHQTNAFTTAVSEGAKAKGEELGVQVDVFDGKQDQAQQASQVEQCISQGYDGILVEPISVDGIVPSVKAANEAGIPVITVVQKMSDQSLAVAYCGGNDAAAGELQMTEAVKALGGKGNIVVLYGPMGSDGQLIRKEGYDKILAENPDVKIVFEDTANWTTDEALTKMETWLQTGTEINAVVAQNDSMALGAQKAIEDVGKQDDILVFGVDAVPEGLDSVAKNKMDGTVSQDAAGQGALGVETMVKHLKGESVEATNYTECIWVNTENVADYQ